MQGLCRKTTSTRSSPTRSPELAHQNMHQADQRMPADDGEGSDTWIAEPEDSELSDWDSLEVDDVEYTDEDLKDFGRPGRRRHVGYQDSTRFGNMQEVRHSCSQRRRCVDEDGRSAGGREKVSRDDREQPENAVEAMTIRLKRAGNIAMCRSRSRRTCSTCGRKRL